MTSLLVAWLLFSFWHLIKKCVFLWFVNKQPECLLMNPGHSLKWNYLLCLNKAIAHCESSCCSLRLVFSCVETSFTARVHSIISSLLLFCCVLQLFTLFHFFKFQTILPETSKNTVYRNRHITMRTMHRSDK